MKKKKVLVHFIPFFFWLFYLVFAFIQPDELKYNSYIETKHPYWGYLPVTITISDDPLGIRRFVRSTYNNPACIPILGAAIIVLLNKFRSLHQSLFKTENELLIILRNTTIQFLLIIAFLLGTKLYFGIRSDIGGYLVASYASFMILLHKLPDPEQV